MTTETNSVRGASGLVAMPGGASEPTVRRLSAPAGRCRPGDIARWTCLQLSPAQGNELRDAATAGRVSVDVWLAVMLEFTGVIDMLGSDHGVRDRLRALQDEPMMIAALPGWRTWQTYVAGRAPTGRDELPEVVLPERLLASAGGAVDVSRALRAVEDWPLARSCELLACGHGQSLEVFVLRAALAGACC